MYRKYKWLLVHDEQIRRTYEHKTFEGFLNVMYKFLRDIDMCAWIPDAMRQYLQ